MPDQTRGSASVPMSIILTILLTVVYVDMCLLKKRDRSLFEVVFTVTRPAALLGLLLAGIVLYFSEDPAVDLPPFVLLSVLPWYIIKRQKFSRRSENQPDITLHVLSNAVGVIVLWIYGIMVFGIFLNGLEEIFPGRISVMGDLLMSAIFSSVLILCLISRASRSLSEKGFLANVGLRKGSCSWPRLIILPAVAGLAFAVLSTYITVTRPIQPQTPLNEAFASTQSVGLILIFFVLAICTAPLIEEIVFRGYFFHVIKQWLGTPKAVISIALTFSLLHVGQYWGDWAAIGMVTLLGFALTGVRAWNKSTISSAVMHYVYNASVTFIPIIAIAVSNPPYFQYKAYYPTLDIQTKEQLLEQAIAKQPDLAEAYNELAWLYAKEGINMDKALILVEQSLRLTPDHPAYLDTKAEVLEQLGRHEEARAIRDRLDSFSEQK